MEYLKTQNAKDGFTQKLDGIVKRMKESNAIQREFMMRNIFVDDWFDRGVAAGEERGVSRGAHDKAVETARNFLADNAGTFEQIAKWSGLPLAEVMQIAKEVVSV